MHLTTQASAARLVARRLHARVRLRRRGCVTARARWRPNDGCHLLRGPGFPLRLPGGLRESLDLFPRGGGSLGMVADGPEGIPRLCGQLRHVEGVRSGSHQPQFGLRWAAAVLRVS
jgi:hypothetical protein